MGRDRSCPRPWIARECARGAAARGRSPGCPRATQRTRGGDAHAGSPRSCTCAVDPSSAETERTSDDKLGTVVSLSLRIVSSNRPQSVIRADHQRRQLVRLGGSVLASRPGSILASGEAAAGGFNEAASRSEAGTGNLHANPRARRRGMPPAWHRRGVHETKGVALVEQR